jgi:23S rRNA pseudouridine2605 synthase
MVMHPKDPSGRRLSGQASADSHGERVARALARAGVASRREAERLIEAGRVALNGEVLTSPAVNVGPDDILTLDGAPIAEREPPRLWRYHKPSGLLTTHNDPKGRPTVFETLPKTLPRVISVGRLDFTSEGLLLLTNDGAVARQLELPSTGVVRRYRARAFGRASQDKLDRLKQGVTVDGVVYGPIEATLERGQGANVWISLSLAEGKNREVRKVLEAIGMKVNRLIRIAYGPFELGELEPGAVEEIPPRQLKPLLRTGFAPGSLMAPPPPRPAKAEPTAQPKPQHRRVRPGSGPGGPRPQGGKGEAPKKAKTAYKPGWARPKSKAKPISAQGQPAKRSGPSKPRSRRP